MTKLSHPRDLRLRRDSSCGQGAKGTWMDIEKQNASGWDIVPSVIYFHIERQDRLRGRVSKWECRMAFWSGWIIWARGCPVEVLKLDTGITPDARELELAESAEG
jgi:hypothetical protein